MHAEAVKSRLALAIYAYGAFCLSTFLVTHFNPIIYNKLYEARQEYILAGELPPSELIYRAGGLQPPHYQWGYGVLPVGLFLIPLVLFGPTILRLIRVGNGSIQRCIYSVLAFVVAAIITFPNFGCDTGLFSWFLCFGSVVGLIEAFDYTIDYSFLNAKDLSEQVKLSNLQTEFNKLMGALALLSAFSIAVGITGLLAYALASSPVVAAEETTLAVSLVFYGAAGLAFGVYLRSVRKINSLNKKILEIRMIAMQPVKSKRVRKPN